MKKFMKTLFALGALAVSAAVLAGTTQLPPADAYVAGKAVYWQKKLAQIEGCDLNTKQLEDRLQDIVNAHNPKITPVVVITKLGDEGNNFNPKLVNRLVEQWTKKGLPATTNIAIVVACADGNVHFAAARPGDGLRPPLLEAKQWQGIESNARPNLKVSISDYVVQVVENTIKQVETNNLASTRLAQEQAKAKAEADKKAAEIARFQQEQRKLATRELADRDDAASGSHWVAWTVGFMVVGGLILIVWLVSRRKPGKDDLASSLVSDRKYTSKPEPEARRIKTEHQAVRPSRDVTRNTPANTYTRVVHGRTYNLGAPSQFVIMNDPYLRQWVGTPHYDYYYNNWLNMWLQWQLMDAVFNSGDRAAAEAMGYREGMRDAYFQHHMGTVNHNTGSNWDAQNADANWTVGGSDAGANDPALANQIAEENGWEVGGSDHDPANKKDEANDWTVGGVDAKVEHGDDDGFTAGGVDTAVEELAVNDFTAGGDDTVEAKESHDDGFTVSGADTEVERDTSDDGFTVGGTDTEVEESRDDGFTAGGFDTAENDSPDDGFTAGGDDPAPEPTDTSDNEWS